MSKRKKNIRKIIAKKLCFYLSKPINSNIPMQVIQKKSERGAVVLLDDMPDIRTAFKNLFQDMDIDLDLCVCSNYEEYEALLSDESMKNRMKCMIMDLSNKPSEVTSQKYYADTLIKKEYDENRIPIFIHSGNLLHYEGYKDEGTVYRIEKSGDSASKICSTIKLMHKSQFLNIFCRNGLLEQKIMGEIHASFTKQYKGNEIENIIKSIEAVNSENLPGRAIEVFQRMAIRSLFYNLTETKFSIDDSVEEIELNSIEHYYRRNNAAIKFWTGDIFKSKAEENYFCVILTPRCNLGHSNFGELLCCRIMEFSTQHFEAFNSQKLDKGEKKGVAAFRKSITDDVTNPLIGEIFRFLPPTPQFSGGLVDFRKLFTITLEEFEESYENSPFISLSEELTNDIVRKFTGYLQRGGISETEINEAYYYYEQLKSQKA